MQKSYFDNHGYNGTEGKHDWFEKLLASGDHGNFFKNMQKDSIDNDTEEEADGLIDEANTSDDSYSEQLTPDREEQLAMQSALERCVAQHNSKHATDQKESSKHFPTIMVPGHGRQYKSTLVRLINEDPHLSKDR
ncbi:uncharacterized protein LOC135693119 isoform X2 [Rhopilema esculentum]